MKKRSLIAIVIATVAIGAVEITNLSEAVNIAGKQRMFTQRMLKDYAMIGMGNTYGDPKKDMEKIVASFNEHLEALQAYAKEPSVKMALQKEATLWKEIEPILREKPALSKAMRLQEKLDALLKAADEATKAFAKSSGKQKDEVVDIAGRQRMLSQRMAALYMLKVWGVRDEKFQEKLNRAMQTFKTSHKRLIEEKINDETTEKLLKKVGRSFMFFEMMSRSESKFVPSLIYKKSNDILTNMDRVTKIYTQKTQ